jgi:hypothetical protein
MLNIFQVTEGRRPARITKVPRKCTAKTMHHSPDLALEGKRGSGPDLMCRMFDRIAECRN